MAMPRQSLRRRRPLRVAVLLGLPGATLLSACIPGGVEEGAVRRGDVAFARDSLEEALAEYRLAIRQGGEEPEVLARAAHTYVALGRVEEATDFYTQAAAREDRWADIGVADLVRLARTAAERNDRFQMASAMEAARRLRPGLGVPDLTLPLARHYLQVGEYARSLPLYQRALAETSSPPAAVVFEIGQAHEQIGDCRSALLFFERFRDLAGARERANADWYIGNCSFRLARELRTREGTGAPELQDALRHVDRALDVGEPRTVQGQAWFEKGEILSALGACDAALEAFTQVRYYESSSASTLVRRAQQRYDEVRIGRGLVNIRGRCG